MTGNVLGASNVSRGNDEEVQTDSLSRKKMGSFAMTIVIVEFVSYIKYYVKVNANAVLHNWLLLVKCEIVFIPKIFPIFRNSLQVELLREKSDSNNLRDQKNVFLNTKLQLRKSKNVECWNRRTFLGSGIMLNLFTVFRSNLRFVI